MPSLKPTVPPSKSEPSRDGGPGEAAHYIKGAIEELATLARAKDLGLLGYLLDMARQEAEEASQRDLRDPT